MGAYVRIVAAVEAVEAAAVKKFGRQPKAGDNLGVTLPYKTFVERETAREFYGAGPLPVLQPAGASTRAPARRRNPARRRWATRT
jgi:hypothetical protein